MSDRNLFKVLDEAGCHCDSSGRVDGYVDVACGDVE